MLAVLRHWPVLALLACSLWPPQTEARCGYPELPFMAQLSSVFENLDVFQNWNYFEERQSVEVICESGLVGFRSPSGGGDRFEIQNRVTIQCRNNRWNSSTLHCVQAIPLAGTRVKSESGMPNAATLSPLVDGNAFSCVDLSAQHLLHSSTLVLHAKLNSSRLVPRISLIVESEREERSGDNVSLVESVIMEMNRLANLSDSPLGGEGNVEVEEAKRFLDFVSTQQLSLLNHTRIPRVLLSTGSGTGDRKERVFNTSHYEIRLSVQTGSGSPSSSSPPSTHHCEFNENVAITGPNVSSQFLIFDCQLDDIVADMVDDISIRIVARKLNDPRLLAEREETKPVIRLCGLDVFALASGQCGKPSVPIYGMVTQAKQVDGKLVAQYSCMSGYHLANSSLENRKSLNSVWDEERGPIVMSRVCQASGMQWTPPFDDILCVPLYSCKNPPPVIDSSKFFFDFDKLDSLKRAIGGVSTATLRCQMLTDYVEPFTQYQCHKSGVWIRVDSSEKEPECRAAPYRGRVRNSHYYRRYYRYYKSDYPRSNRTLFGRQLTDNKYLTYYGTAGIVLLFGGSFLILFHVRRMAKKISRQMRERAYMNVEKGGSEGFMPMNTGLDSNLPPYYTNEANYFDANLYSSDLPPPTTPISMPSVTNRGKEKGANPGANFDSIKF